MKIILQILVLSAASMAIGLGLNGLSSKPLSLLAAPEQFKEKVEEGMEAHKSEILEIWQSGNAIFIDSRSEDAFNEGHIPGALSIPYGIFEEGGIPEAVSLLPQDQMLVIYCDGADCHASQVVSDKLQENGFEKKNMKIFSGGWTEWLEIGGEVESVNP